jgi:hypothetical protein
MAAATCRWCSRKTALHPSCFLPDYAAGDPHTIHWFMHEMVLV